jgi:hypothetical protein
MKNWYAPYLIPIILCLIFGGILWFFTAIPIVLPIMDEPSTAQIWMGRILCIPTFLTAFAFFITAKYGPSDL